MSMSKYLSFDIVENMTVPERKMAGRYIEEVIEKEKSDIEQAKKR